MKKLLSFILAMVMVLSLAACGNFKQSDYPKIEEIEYYFSNGASYGESVVLMGFSNNSKYTITSVKIHFAIRQDATKEELSAFDPFVNDGDLDSDELISLNPYVYDYMVCDPGETVEGANCYLFGYTQATDSKQCDVLTVKNAEISFQGKDDKIYTVSYTAENNVYTLSDITEVAKSWTEKDFAEAIPMPDTRFITVNYDEDDYYQFTAYDIAFEEYCDYCNECKFAGFSNEIEDNEISFWCTNDNNLTLNIRYFAYMNAFTVEARIKS